MDNFPPEYRLSVEESLRELGFSNASEIFETAKFEKDPVYDNHSQISLFDPSSNPNDISFHFIARPRIDDEGYSIQQVTASKEFRPHIHSMNTKTIEQSYAIFSGIPPKEYITHEMLLQMRHERNRQELSENKDLRKQLTKMGFDYDKLLAGTYEINTDAPAFKGVTIVHEELPILGDRPQNPKNISFVLHFRKLPKQLHHLDAIYTTVNRGRSAEGMSNPHIEYHHSNGKFPTKWEMIENLSKIMPQQYSTLSNAQQLLHLVNVTAQEKPMNVMRRFQLKRR
ncbi:hypothetical protein [Puia dinghuensis]|uniref:Uncharacterized protein n=1 Tax=Puia dinghuensis TaxID=1792502 RepID=A0A8J2UJ53_9BACT|nr:hypothetical protein [Puia dinghuensis]GGB26137.1 hypothetical protein GCM10011511_57640 [Puia dinghuensis]